MRGFVQNAQSEHSPGNGDAHRSLSIFVPHGATLLTDHESHGDGLIQWAFLRELARRGHRLTVLTPALSVKGPIPPGIEIHEIGGENMSLLRYVLHARGIFDRLSRHRRFDLVHQMNPVVRGASLAWAFTGIPVVLGTYVGDWPYEVPLHRMKTATPSEWARMAVKLVLDATQQLFARRLLLATPFALNRIPFHRAMRGRFSRVRHGMDVESYTPDATPGDPATLPHSILFVGQILPHKGIAVLVAAFEIVRRALPDAKLVIVGAGAMERWIALRAREGGWASELELVGPVAHDRVPGWLRACSILCSTALGEPCGTTILEALACGKPVIVNDSGGSRYLVEGTANPVVPMGDPEALAAAILALLRDPDRARAIGEENRRFALATYSWARVVDDLERAYREALEVRA